MRNFYNLKILQIIKPSSTKSFHFINFTLADAIEPNLNAFSFTLFAPKDNKFQPVERDDIVESKAMSDCDRGHLFVFPKPAYFPPSDGRSPENKMSKHYTRRCCFKPSGRCAF